MAMQSGRLPRRKSDPGAFDEANGRVRDRQLLFHERFALERGKGASAIAIVSAIRDYRGRFK
jgi:hypothetical protein